MGALTGSGEQLKVQSADQLEDSCRLSRRLQLVGAASQLLHVHKNERQHSLAILVACVGRVVWQTVCRHRTPPFAVGQATMPEYPILVELATCLSVSGV